MERLKQHLVPASFLIATIALAAFIGHAMAQDDQPQHVRETAYIASEQRAKQEKLDEEIAFVQEKLDFLTSERDKVARSVDRLIENLKEEGYAFDEATRRAVPLQ